jgi:hypothetical protein
LISGAFFSDRFGFTLGIAGDQRAVGAGRRFGVSEDVNPFVDLFFEFVFVDEAVDLERAEEMADTAWSKGGRFAYTRVGGV